MTIDNQSVLRTLQTFLADAKEAKSAQWISYFEGAIENLYEANLIFKCPSCGDYEPTFSIDPEGCEMECDDCSRDRAIRKSDSQDFESRSL